MGSAIAAKTFSGGVLNAYLAVSFIKKFQDEGRKRPSSFLVDIMRGWQPAPVPAWSGHTQGAPGTPRMHGCPRVDRPRQRPHGPPYRSRLPKGPIRARFLPL